NRIALGVGIDGDQLVFPQRSEPSHQGLCPVLGLVRPPEPVVVVNPEAEVPDTQKLTRSDGAHGRDFLVEDSPKESARVGGKGPPGPFRPCPQCAPPSP